MLKCRWIGFCSLVLVGLAASLSAQTPAAKPAAQTKPAAAPVKLPAVVDAAFKKAYPQATIKNVIHETEDGIEQYEVESITNGLKLDVNYKPDGTVIVVEQEVTAADLPAAVTAAIAKRYPKATMTLREKATESKKTYYEIGLTGAPVKTVQLTPDGQWISPKPGK